MLTAALALSGPVAAADSLTDGRDKVSVDELRQTLAEAPAGVRGQMSNEQMRRFVENFLLDKRLEAAARAAKLDQRADVRFRMEKASRDVLIKAFVEGERSKFTAALPDVTKIAQERYELDKTKYVVPEGIRVAHILIREDEEKGVDAAAAKKTAEKVLAELRAGGDFAKLAKEYSADRTSLNGGELPGWQPRGKLVKPFETAAYGMKPGEISDVVKTQFGYHIIKLIEHRDSSPQPFEQVKDQIATTIRNEMLKEKWEEWQKAYRGPERVEIDDATLEQLRKP
jgi:parvulin-like peptidyl-prolyl isomerase